MNFKINFRTLRIATCIRKLFFLNMCLILYFYIKSIEALSEDRRILKHILVYILTIKHGLEDNIVFIQQIRQVESTNGCKLKNVLLEANTQHIGWINTVYQLGTAWLNEEIDLDIRFLDTLEEAGLYL